MAYYNRNRNYKKKTKKNTEPNRILKLNCPKHGELIADTSWNKYILYESLNKETQSVETKCYKCLDEQITEKKNEIRNRELQESGGITPDYFSKKAYFYEWATIIFLVITGFGSFFVWAFFDGMSAILNAGVFGLLTLLFYWRERYLDKKSMEFSMKSKVHSIRNAQSILREESFDVSNWRQKQEKIKKEKVKYSFAEIDKMTGIEFENCIRNLLQKSGYDNPQLTKASGDEGVDIIAYKNGKKIAFQCKRYTGKISNSAVQQVYSGKTYHDCHEACVITNSQFTENAITLAKKLKVKLIDRDGLFDLMEQVRGNLQRGNTEYQAEFKF